MVGRQRTAVTGGAVGNGRTKSVRTSPGAEVSRCASGGAINQSAVDSVLTGGCEATVGLVQSPMQ